MNNKQVKERRCGWKKERKKGRKKVWVSVGSVMFFLSLLLSGSQTTASNMELERSLCLFRTANICHNTAYEKNNS